MQQERNVTVDNRMVDRERTHRLLEALPEQKMRLAAVSLQGLLETVLPGEGFFPSADTVCPAEQADVCWGIPDLLSGDAILIEEIAPDMGIMM